MALVRSGPPVRRRADNHLSAAEWDEKFPLLLSRAGGLCEARTEACSAPGGRLEALPRDRVSIQHRRAQGLGGTDLTETNGLSNLLLICGTGVSACHGWIENDERGLAEQMGLWVRHTYEYGEPVPVALYPVRVGGGRWRVLHPTVPLYVDLPLSLAWSPTMPDLIAIMRSCDVSWEPLQLTGHPPQLPGGPQHP